MNLKAKAMIPKHVGQLFAQSRALWVNGKQASNGVWFADGVTAKMLAASGYKLCGNVWRR